MNISKVVPWSIRFHEERPVRWEEEYVPDEVAHVIHQPDDSVQRDGLMEALHLGTEEI